MIRRRLYWDVSATRGLSPDQEDPYYQVMYIKYVDRVIASYRDPRGEPLNLITQERLKAFLWTLRKQGERYTILRWEHISLFFTIRSAKAELSREVRARGEAYVDRWLAGMPQTKVAVARLAEIKKLLSQPPSQQQTL